MRRKQTIGKNRIGRKNRVSRKLSSRKIVNSSKGNVYWQEKAYAAGRLAASGEVSATNDPHKKANECWNRWYHSVNRGPRPYYHAAAAKFLKGYFGETGGGFGNRVLVPTARTIAAIVTVMNEKDTVPSVLEQLHRLPLHEMIFVINGSTDESFEIIRNQSSATIVHYHSPLGHDVGRAIGAKLAESDILLFLDGDFPIFAEHLVPFIEAIEQGMDIALNNISPYIGPFAKRDDVTTVKEFVNRSLAKPELRANSLTAIPHAMTKQAAEQIGYSNLEVPPKAQMIAIGKGLKIGSATSVDVISGNRVRLRNRGRNNAVSHLILGDHLEALNAVLDLGGPRLSFPDRVRRRHLI